MFHFRETQEHLNVFGVNLSINFENFTLISYEISLFNLSIKQSAFQIFKEQCVSRKEFHFLSILV